jgi:hypothetical protein
MRTPLSLDQWVESIVGCEHKTTWKNDFCVDKENPVTQQSLETLQFTSFHEQGPVEGAYHHATKKGKVLLDIQTFLSPSEDPLKIRDILKSVKWL